MNKTIIGRCFVRFSMVLAQFHFRFKSMASPIDPLASCLLNTVKSLVSGDNKGS